MGKFYKGSKAAIIVFSHTDDQSFADVETWLEDIKKYCGDLPVVLFGNKVDLADAKKLKDDKARDLVKKKKLLGYYKTSAKTGTGVYEGFQAIIQELYNKFKQG